jgi:anion-transporting  ArsA/GET3 family ATPase
VGPGELFEGVEVLIVAGKGGVGKTTTTAVLARAASTLGRRVLAVDIEGKRGLATAFGASSLRYEEQVLVEPSEKDGGVLGRTLPPDDALVEYLDDHGLRRLSHRLTRTGMLDLVASATPGIKDILVLGKIRQLAERPDIDLVVVDAPAAGHAISFLRAPATLLEMARMGPIHSQSERAVQLLQDGSRTRVVLVTMAEETPVTELIETAFSLEDLVGVHLGPVVVNGCEPRLDGPADPSGHLADQHGPELAATTIVALDQADSYRRSRRAVQDQQLQRLAAELPLPRIELDWVYRPSDGRDLVEQLAASVVGR